MKKDVCNDVMEKFLMKDKNELLPLSVIFHIIRCRECRTTVRRMTLAEKNASMSLMKTVPQENPTLDAVMKKVCAMELASGKAPKSVNLAGWIIAGVIMIAAMMFFGFYTSPQKTSFMLIMAFYLLFALAIVVYCIAFVTSNLDFFVKKISFRKTPVSAA